MTRHASSRLMRTSAGLIPSELELNVPMLGLLIDPDFREIELDFCWGGRNTGGGSMPFALVCGKVLACMGGPLELRLERSIPSIDASFVAIFRWFCKGSAWTGCCCDGGAACCGGCFCRCRCGPGGSGDRGSGWLTGGLDWDGGWEESADAGGGKELRLLLRRKDKPRLGCCCRLVVSTGTAVTLSKCSVNRPALGDFWCPLALIFRDQKKEGYSKEG